MEKMASEHLLPRLHILKLHQDPAPDENYETFSWRWLLDDDSEELESEMKEISPGDVVFFPELLTGAGEFEGMRFVGARQEVDNRLALYNAGIEYPEFPPVTVILQQERQLTLRAAYAALIDTLLQRQTGGPDSLEAVFGGSAQVNKFWNEPAILRKDPNQGEWVIPLRDCQRKETISFSS
jgi:hypothetical protein